VPFNAVCKTQKRKDFMKMKNQPEPINGTGIIRDRMYIIIVIFSLVVLAWKFCKLKKKKSIKNDLGN
jgi:hypothetical protein